MTQGAGAIAIVLIVRQHEHSLALGGAVAGALALAAGVARPLQGRLMDRRGGASVITACGIVHPVALAAIVVLARSQAPGATLLLAGAVAGLFLPPISTSMRVEWGAAAGASDRTAAYSLVYLTQELSILTGPLVLAAVIAAASVALGLLVVAALSAAGTLSYAASLRARETAAAGSASGALKTPGIRAAVAIAVLVGATIGGIEVGAPAFATAHHSPAASGLLIAALSVGGIVGAVLYGAVPWQSGPRRRLPALLALLTATLGLTVAGGGLVLVGAELLIAGLALNPALTTISLLADEAVRSRSAAEAFGWLSTGLSGGTGAASALAGALAGRHGDARVAFAVAAISGALGLALSLSNPVKAADT